jgi:hypothetical protein
MEKLLFFTLSIILFSCPALAGINPPGEYKEGEVLVFVKTSDALEHDIAVILAREFDIVFISSNYLGELAKISGISRFLFRSDSKSTKELIKELSSSPYVLSAGPNFIVYASSCDINLNKKTTSIHVNETEKLTVTITPTDVPQTLIWVSSNTDVAIVSEDGLVTAISQGTANITVCMVESNIIATCMITVTDSNKGSDSGNGSGCNAMSYGVLGFALIFVLMLNVRKYLKAEK